MLISHYLFSGKSATKPCFVRSTASPTEMLPLDLQDKSSLALTSTPVCHGTNGAEGSTNYVNKMSPRCQFPFQGSGSPPSLALGVHLPGTKSFFCLPSSSGSVPRQEGLLAALLCCAQQLQISIPSGGAKAVPSTTAQQNSSWGRATAWTPGEEGASQWSHRQESLLSSASPSPLYQKSEFLFLNALRGVTGHLPVSSLPQFSIPPKN